MSIYHSLKKERIRDFLGALTKKYRLIMPQKAENGDFLFQETDNLDKICLDYGITSNTIKEFFFPRQETIFEYQKEGGAFKVRPLKEKTGQETIFCGLRSCDIRSVYFQDCFFMQDPPDLFYWQRRNKGILISLACNKPPAESCFCVHTKSGPFLQKGDGFDLQLVDLGKNYLVEIGTMKGASLVKKHKKFFKPLDKASLNKKASLKENCLKQFSQKYDLLSVQKKLKGRSLQALWEDLGGRCTNCAGCEFICPTCFCSYLEDVRYSAVKGKKIKAWDSCTFSGYSRMSGGANPCQENSLRISRRFFCKLYNGLRWFNIFGCTGCGRCSFVCPVNLDMESFISSLMQSEQYKPLLKAL